jgi:hypothetical protein
MMRCNNVVRMVGTPCAAFAILHLIRTRVRKGDVAMEAYRAGAMDLNPCFRVKGVYGIGSRACFGLATFL